jgi:hypothetical protein
VEPLEVVLSLIVDSGPLFLPFARSFCCFWPFFAIAEFTTALGEDWEEGEEFVGSERIGKFWAAEQIYYGSAEYLI